jgi:hypothetical protein
MFGYIFYICSINRILCLREQDTIFCYHVHLFSGPINDGAHRHPIIKRLKREI